MNWIHTCGLRASLIRLCVALACLASHEAAGAESRSVLLHLQTGITQDDNPMCAAFNVALAALEAGDKVELLFDAGAIFDLQDAPSRGDDTAATSQPTSQSTQSSPAGASAYNLKYELPDKLKQILSQQFGMPVSELPHTYFDYLRMLHGRGARITFNGAMAHLVSLSDSVTGTEAVTDLATPLNLAQIVEHRAGADIYFAY